MIQLRALAVFSLVLTAHLNARETIRLHNGYSFEADSHSEEQDIVLFRMGTGTMRIAKGDIKEIQNVDDKADPASAVLGAVVERPEDLLRRAARAQGVDEAFMRSVAKVESGLRQNALSSKGARGLMQLMPGTAAGLKVDAAKPGDNALGGAMYLRQLLLQFRGDSALALAAYNAGPGAVAKFKGIPPYAETHNYILKVLAEYKVQLQIAQAAVLAASKPGALN